ncbi:histidine kinase [Deltaproteobacteria bacterium]|nr:histidine kinase [Deltaproteobacteria bacterium]
MSNIAAFKAISPTVAAFLQQISDTYTDNNFFLGYAQSVILPATGWEKENFLFLLTRDLSSPANEALLTKAQEKQQAGIFQPFSFNLTTVAGKRASFLALPRPGTRLDGNARIVVSLAAQTPHLLRSKQETSPFDQSSPVFKLLDILPAYVMLIDEKHKILFSNRLARQLFGKTDDKSCYQALHHFDAPCAQCPPFSIFSHNRLRVHDWINAQMNAAFRTHSYPFQAAGGKTYILQIGINITAGVHARNALDLSEKRYRSIAENLAVGLALVDTNFRIITLNPRMVDWFGPYALKGASLADLLQNTCVDGPDGPALLFASVLTYKNNLEREFTLALQTAEERHFRLVLSPILTGNKHIRAIVIMLEDVTDNRNLAARLLRVQRLEALGSLAAGISHEINQPLSALQLYASGMQMLLENSPETPVELVQERIALILAQADKIGQIVSHMRALVMQEENPPPTPIRVTDAVSAAMGLVGMQMRDHDVAVIIDLPENLPLVMANLMQMEQVVINLLVNAMHALNTVERSAKTIRITAEIHEGGLVTVRFTDNGPGLGSIQQHIFDPFFSTKESPLSMGLGLSIVLAFVTSWGGVIDAANNAETPGATFSITLHEAEKTAQEELSGTLS